MALAALLVLAGCHEAYGGGYIGEPVPGDVVGVYQGEANFGFNFTCDVNERAKQGRDQGPDHLPRQPQHHRRSWVPGDQAPSASWTPSSSRAY